MINKLIKRLIGRTARPLVKNYLSKTREYNYDSVTVEIPPGVFHPGLFFSTKILLKYILQFDLKNKSLLELGAGSGLISICAAKKGAYVTATDVSHQAIQTVETNAQANQVEFDIIYSDLWNNLPQQNFDLIVVNPPYYFSDPKNEAEFGWYAGANGEYFENFFHGLKNFISDQTKTLMILSNECRIDDIKKVAVQYGFHMNSVFKKKTGWEVQTIFEIQKHEEI